ASETTMMTLRNNMLSVGVCVLFALTWAPALGCAQAQTTTLIFACEGKLTGSAISEDKPEPLHNVGLVVNLKDRTVSFGGFVAPFKAAKLPFPVHPHMLRHSTGYKLANDGHDTPSQPAINSTLHRASAGSVCKVLAGLKANSVEHAPVPPGALLRG